MLNDDLISLYNQHAYLCNTDSVTICNLIDEIDKLRIVVATYDVAAKKFIAKVESERARSVETYKDLKNALEISEKIR